MITETGKNILAKYLIGQAPAYASYIAIGCGATPVDSGDSQAQLGDYSNQKSLEFEMFRVPITSRGYVSEDGVSKVVLTAELPTEERYEITEVGIYSAGSNPAAGSYDSKIVYAFIPDENWEYHTATSAGAMDIIYSPLDNDTNNNVIDQPKSVFQTNADNRIFTNQSRIDRYERCRFFNNIVVMSGDSSNLEIAPVTGRLVPATGSEHIHLAGANLDFNRNAPSDALKFAFSVVNKDGLSTNNPDSVRVLLSFASTDVHGTGQSAQFEIVLNSEDYDFETQRYFIATKNLGDLIKSTGFTWASVDVVQIYASVIVEGEPSSDYYVCLDALRFENTNTVNPLYGLTGYSVLRTEGAAPVVKNANTTNYIEFRFAMDVQ